MSEVAPSPRPLVRPGNFISRWFSSAVISFLRHAPQSFRKGLASTVAFLAWHLRIRRSVALENLSFAFPQLSDGERNSLARRCYRHLALTALEVLVSGASAGDIPEVEIDNYAAFDKEFQKGAVLIASAHLGAWELFADVMARRLGRLSAVVRPLEGAFNAHIVRARQEAGVNLILQRGALKGMLRAVKEGHVVVQLIDQALPLSSGILVPFFGRAACTTPALSTVAARTGAPVFVAVAVRDENRLKVHVEGPIPLAESGDRKADIAAHTAQLTAIIERQIRKYPEQWMWLHRRWKQVD